MSYPKSHYAPHDPIYSRAHEGTSVSSSTLRQGVAGTRQARAVVDTGRPKRRRLQPLRATGHKRPFKMIQARTLGRFLEQSIAEEPILEDSANLHDELAALETQREPVRPVSRDAHTIAQERSRAAQAASWSFDQIYESADNPIQTPYASSARRDLPFCIVDVREEAVFRQGHIVSSTSFPLSSLARSNAQLSPDLYAFREVSNKAMHENKEKRPLVVVGDRYDADVARMATFFVEHSFPVVVVLKGGIPAFASAFPQYIKGTYDFSSAPPVGDDDQMTEVSFVTSYTSFFQ